jgi:hypothetical protein
MKTNNYKYSQLASASLLAITAFTGLLATTAANAAQVTGNAYITFDNTAFKASNNYSDIVQTYWGASDNLLGITGNTPGGTTLPTTGSTGPLLFSVNTNLTTTACPSCGTYGRTLQATTMDTSNTSIGQIGLSGALRLNNTVGNGLVTPYDFSLVKTAGVWNIQTFDTAFQTQNFMKLTNVSESLDSNGQLLLSGDLQWTGLWASVAQANTNVVVGSISLTPAAVPVPAAVWLFSSALTGLVGIQRRRRVVPA